MGINRRFFIGGLASLVTVGSRELFAVAPGSFTDGKPNLAFGVLSDVHIALAKGGRKLIPSRSTKYLEKALAYFRDCGVHAVVIAGDITNDGVVGELKAVADAWCRVFPNDKALEDDLVMPLPAAESKPFAFASRAAAIKPPAFPRGAALAFRITEAKARGAKKGTSPKRCMEIEIPSATAGGRCVRYEIVTKGTGGKTLKIALLAESFRFASSDKRTQAPAKCRIALDRLAAGEVPVSVVAYSTWDKASEPLKGVFTV